jgi:hypothetical protein
MRTVETRTIPVAVAICLLLLVVVPALASVTFSSSTPQIITKGNTLSITGTGAVNGTAALWIIGRNFIDRQIVIPDAKGNFTYSFTSADTRQYTSGQYAFVIQDPGQNQRLDIEYRVDDNGDIVLQNQGKTFADIGARENLKASVVPLISTFSATAANPGADDIFIPYYFFVEDPSIGFDNIIPSGESPLPDVTAGNTIVFSGPTNLDTHDTLRGEIRDRNSGSLVASATLAIKPGSTENQWSWVLAAPGLSPGSYQVTVWRPNAFVNCSGTAFFTVLPVPSTTGPAGNATAAFPWAGDPLLPVIILFGIALVVGSILFASRNR